ncbi:hypothetical protein LTR08_000627 [Meristemomyces frigidus]|nr:hypothetical protein LTR08_000627 [Meristemomyces frigidus]
MAPKSIVDLPTELLDRIYDYLDWNRAADLVPHRENIINISLTCRRLRESVLPLLFRNVTLCLRFIDGALTEPSLLALRRQRPDLAQHVRCVHIATKIGYPQPQYSISSPDASHGKRRQRERALFNVPADVDDWLNPESAAAPASAHVAELGAAHRERVDGVVAELAERVPHFHPSATDQPGSAESVVQRMVVHMSYASQEQRALMPKPPAFGFDDPSSSMSAPAMPAHLPNYQRIALNSRGRDLSDLAGDVPDGESTSSASSTWKMQTGDEDLKRQIDALATVLLCLPAATTELIFETGMHGGVNSPDNIFALHVLATAMRVFGPSLERLTMILSTYTNAMRTSLHGHMPAPESVDGRIVSAPVIAHLTKLKTLVLSSTPDPRGITHFGSLKGGTPNLERWLALPTLANLTTLNLWNIHATDAQSFGIANLFQPISALPALKHLTLTNLCLSARRPLQLGQPAVHTTDTNELAWLHLLIALRRAAPAAAIALSNPHCEVAQSHGALSRSAARWLALEAVPAGACVDEGREERLLADFASFLPLWAAEDGGRGRLAAEERESGELVDAALCSRSRQFANVRRDQGEWTTM